METAAVIALLVKAAVDAIVAAVNAGQSHETILRQIQHLGAEPSELESEVDAVADGR